MAQNAPGKHYRKGLSLVDAVKQFSDEEYAEKVFVEARWPNGIVCQACGSLTIQKMPSRKPAPFRCHDCHDYFSVKTGTVMEGSNLPLSKWAMAIYLLNTNLKGVSSMKLHRDLGIHPKDGMASGSPHTQGMERRPGYILRACGDRRDVHRRQGKEQARQQETPGWARASGQDGGKWVLATGTRDG